MKKSILFTILFFCEICANAQLKVSVDERFELTGIVFRLTGEKIFAQTAPENYVTDIDSCFSKYKEHELIQFLRKTLDARKSHWDFSMIADLAADIEISSKGIVWTRQWGTLYESEAYSQQDDAWSKTELKEYLRLLNRFYKDTKFRQFFTAHRTFYDTVENNMRRIVAQIDTAWFVDFFGQPFSLENVWVVPANGRHNFSLDKKDAKGLVHHHCVLGYTDISNPYDVFSSDLKTLTVLIHEICHNYNNPVCDRFMDSFRPACDSIYPYVKNDLNYNHYGYESIVYEGMNRLCEYAYFQAHHSMDSAKLAQRIFFEELDGFLWLGEMLDYLKVFYLNREKFPDYEAFMPQFVLFMQQVADRMQNYYLPKRRSYNLLQPQVIATYPANGAVVDTSIDKIIIIFSRPMQDVRIMSFVRKDSILPLPVKSGCYTINDKGEKEFDYESTECMYWKDRYTYVLPLKEPLKPKSKYGYKVPGKFSETRYYFPAVPFELIFETK